MKAKDITVGMKVFMKVSGNVVPVRVDSIREMSNYKGRSSTVYGCTNLKTGRPCSARSASKFRGPVPDSHDGLTDIQRKFVSKGQQMLGNAPAAGPTACDHMWMIRPDSNREQCPKCGVFK